MCVCVYVLLYDTAIDMYCRRLFQLGFQMSNTNIPFHIENLLCCQCIVHILCMSVYMCIVYYSVCCTRTPNSLYYFYSVHTVVYIIYSISLTDLT